MFKKMLKNERGLTLIELLAVVVILGIIAAIAVPAIGNVIQKSKVDAYNSDALQILSAADIYEANVGRPTSAIDEAALKDYLKGSKIEDFTVAFDATNNVYRITTPAAVTVGNQTVKYTGASKKDIENKVTDKVVIGTPGTTTTNNN
ncbi:prepilin-type N-terminal cleavage/methylation domain-containing protein [Metabacillus indicus]|uniref:type IV pilin protein n=1 Tax=Metabacillus indicus TaxID=246786 RepID=UPI002A03B304|nr:prepilin-type N-terminal cleavage/methylation domain-containing protein [Metabacillus indicus]MDX8290006.1 prepilin-type N-terminal cleavage/methylation domain-containing protein [Metabacillus indicus]